LRAFNISDMTTAEKLSRLYIKIRNSKHILFPETLDTLTLLKPDYDLGLITNGAPDLQWKKIKGGGLTSYFKCVVISGEYGIGKPDERLFLLAIKKLKTKKKNVLMVGDSLRSDIKGAAAAGIKTVWINRERKKVTGIQPDFEIDNMLKLHRVLGKKY
jgi:putative hydrolase of the HAD superfamily